MSICAYMSFDTPMAEPVHPCGGPPLRTVNGGSRSASERRVAWKMRRVAMSDRTSCATTGSPDTEILCLRVADFPHGGDGGPTIGGSAHPFCCVPIPLKPRRPQCPVLYGKPKLMKLTRSTWGISTRRSIPRATGRRICDVDPVRAGRGHRHPGVSPEVLAARAALTRGLNTLRHALTTGLMMSTGTQRGNGVPRTRNRPAVGEQSPPYVPGWQLPGVGRAARAASLPPSRIPGDRPTSASGPTAWTRSPARPPPRTWTIAARPAAVPARTPAPARDRPGRRAGRRGDQDPARPDRRRGRRLGAGRAGAGRRRRGVRPDLRPVPRHRVPVHLLPGRQPATGRGPDRRHVPARAQAHRQLHLAGPRPRRVAGHDRPQPGRRPLQVGALPAGGDHRRRPGRRPGGPRAGGQPRGGGGRPHHRTWPC
jgi:hypothetical protein